MKKSFLIILLAGSVICKAQSILQPGFSGEEYRQMMEIFARQFDSIKFSSYIPVPSDYHRVYRSPETALKNRWELWYRNDEKLGAINIRGTIADVRSWMENFYAAMIPAIGSLQLNDSTQFSYKLASDSGAMVHVGWVVGLAFMAPSILEQINLSYQKGIKEFLIFGHSQGGALAYLLCSYLYYQQKSGLLPSDIRWKTYCSAAPDPGNLNYAYDFDFITRNNWAFNVVNTIDWVPQTPITIQTLRDFPMINPFKNVDRVLKKQPMVLRWYLKSKFRKMDKATTKAQKRFEKYLGKLVAKQIRKVLPQFQPPAYAPGNNYQRAAVPIVLQPNDEYRKRFPDNPKNVFVHHMLEPYYYLSKVYYP